MRLGGPHDCELLAASAAAYCVASGATVFVPDAVFAPRVPYLAPPAVAAGGPGLVNCATVGRCPFGIVVAFRGTISPTRSDPDSWVDWLYDFFAVPVAGGSGLSRLPGQVHRGFLDAVTSIIEEVHALVAALDPGPTAPVFITGHSKGGAMATIGSLLLARDMGIPVVEPVVTFASPRAGDAAFRAGFDACLRQIRYENAGDVVPLVPPSLTRFEEVISRLFSGTAAAGRLRDLLHAAREWNYAPVGEKLFVTRRGTLTAGEPDLLQQAAVMAELMEDVVTGDFSSFARAHSLAPGGGYFRGVCGG